MTIRTAHCRLLRSRAEGHQTGHCHRDSFRDSFRDDATPNTPAAHWQGGEAAWAVINQEKRREQEEKGQEKRHEPVDLGRRLALGDLLARPPHLQRGRVRALPTAPAAPAAPPQIYGRPATRLSPFGVSSEHVKAAAGATPWTMGRPSAHRRRPMAMSVHQDWTRHLRVMHAA